MKKIIFQALDYAFERDWVLRIWFFGAWVALIAVTWGDDGPSGWAIVCAVALHMQGMLEGAKTWSRK